MRFFNKNKNKTKTTTKNQSSIMLDFYNDWFHIKYHQLFDNPYLAEVNYVYQNDIARSMIDTLVDPTEQPQTLEQALNFIPDIYGTISTLEAAFIVVGQRVLQSPTLMLDDQFHNYAHEVMPRLIESLRMLSEYGESNNYPTNRLGAVLENIKLVPSFTIQSAIQKEHQVSKQLDIAFYEKLNDVYVHLYSPLLEIIETTSPAKVELARTLSMVESLMSSNQNSSEKEK